MTSKPRALAPVLDLALGLGLVGSFAAGCLVTNQNHCGLNQGACGNGLMCSVCAQDNNGCVPSDSVLDSACLYAGASSEGPTGATDTTATSISPTTESTVNPTFTTESTTPDPTTTIGPTSMVTVTTTEDPSATASETTVGPACEGDVVDNPKCGGDAPYCVDGSCIGCPDADCKTIDPSKPACLEASGLCVECLEHSDCLSDDKPACDPDTAKCKPCSEHEECATTACDLETGMCLPEDCVFFVDQTKGGDTPCSDFADGKAPETALCTLQKAATLLQPDKPCTIKVKAGTQFQTAPTVINQSNITVAIVHYGGGVPSISGSGNAALTIGAGNRVYMNRVAVTNDSNPGIECSGSVLWLNNQRIFATKTAMHAIDCEVHVRRSIIFGHTQGGLDIQGTDPNKAQLWLENSYITSMNSSIFGAIRLIGAVKAELLYTTIALVKSAVPPIDCIGGFNGTLDIRNSAIIGPQPRYGNLCNPALDHTFESDAGSQGELGDTFSTFNGGQLQAKVGGTLKDVAQWQTGDPKVDQDGTPRPAVDAAPDYAGADRPR